MNRPNETPPIPDGLAAEGIQGVGCKADGYCVTEHSPHGSAPLFLARVAIDAARAQLDAYAVATDEPRPGTVEAADFLDAARAALDGAL